MIVSPCGVGGGPLLLSRGVDVNQGEILDNLLHLFEFEQRWEAALTCQVKKNRVNEDNEEKTKSVTSKRLFDLERELLTVQTHIVEGEDSGPTGGSRAMEGHVQDAMWSLNTVLLEKATRTNTDLTMSTWR